MTKYGRRTGLTIMAALVLMAGAIALAPVSSACDGGNYYEPSHQICQPFPPAYPQPGYGGCYNGGYYVPSDCGGQPCYPPSPYGYGGAQSCFSFNGFLFSYYTCS